MGLEESGGVYILEFTLEFIDRRCRSQRFKVQERSDVPLLTSRWRRPCGNKYGQTLEAESGPILTASKERRTSDLQPQLNSTNNLNDFRSRLLPRDSREEFSRGNPSKAPNFLIL